MKTFLGIVLFLVLLITSIFWLHPRYQAYIERDLRMKAAAVLTSHGLDATDIQISAHSLTEIGELPSSAAERKALRDDLDGIIGLYVDVEIDLGGPAALPPSPPSFHLVEQADQSVILTGVVRDEAQRSYLMRIASTPVNSGGAERSVIDRLELNGEVGAIQPTEKLSLLAPQILTNATEGSLSWTPSYATMGGLLENSEQESALLKIASATLPAEVAPVTSFQIQPYQNLDLGITRGDESIVLTGLLPSAAAQGRLLNLVQAEAEGRKVIDQTTIAVRPRTGWWAEGLEGNVSSFLATTVGPAELHYSNERFTAEANFREEKDHAAMRNLVNQMPSEVERSASFTFVEKPAPLRVTPSPDAPIMSAIADTPAAAEEKLALAGAAMIKRLKPLAVYFDTSSAKIQSRQNRQINDAARIILKTKDVTQGLTVAGYADLRGDAELNRTLSLKRANAVRSRLIAKGVPAERLTVNHFGEDTSQTSKKNLWKSRRVEISLTKTVDESAAPTESAAPAESPAPTE